MNFANQFKIWSGWKPRKEAPEELGRRLLHCIDSISALHPAFRDWEVLNLARSPDEMTEENYREFLRPLEKVRSQMTDFVAEWGVSTDEGEPEPRDGYSVSISNDTSNLARYVNFSAHGGGLESWTTLPRYASFETNYRVPADPTIVAYSVFKAVLLAIVSCWDVDFVEAYSRDLVQLWARGRPFYELSWMVYLSVPLARKIAIPTDVTIERTSDGGILMIAAEETFDVNNPKHIAGAQSILAALEPLNVEEAKRWAEWERRNNTWRPPKSGQ